VWAALVEASSEQVCGERCLVLCVDSACVSVMLAFWFERRLKLRFLCSFEGRGRWRFGRCGRSDSLTREVLNVIGLVSAAFTSEKSKHPLHGQEIWRRWKRATYIGGDLVGRSTSPSPLSQPGVHRLHRSIRDMPARPAIKAIVEGPVNMHLPANKVTAPTPLILMTW